MTNIQRDVSFAASLSWITEIFNIVGVGSIEQSVDIIIYRSQRISFYNLMEEVQICS